MMLVKVANIERHSVPGNTTVRPTEEIFVTQSNIRNLDVMAACGATQLCARLSIDYFLHWHCCAEHV